MTTIPCPDCVDGFIDDDPCARIRCIAGQIELTDAEVRAIEAEQCNVRT